MESQFPPITDSFELSGLQLALFRRTLAHYVPSSGDAAVVAGTFEQLRLAAADFE